MPLQFDINVRFLKGAVSVFVTAMGRHLQNHPLFGVNLAKLNSLETCIVDRACCMGVKWVTKFRGIKLGSYRQKINSGERVWTKKKTRVLENLNPVSETAVMFHGQRKANCKNYQIDLRMLQA
jgi:hypothetical protein